MAETARPPMSDHDLLLRIDEKLEHLIDHQHVQDKRIRNLAKRTSALERLRDEGRGAARVMRLIWVVMAGIAGIAGYKFRGAH